MFLDGVALVLQVVLFALFLAFAIERLVEKFVKPPLQRRGWEAATPYVALFIGAFFSVLFGIDLFTPIAEAVGLEPLAPWAGLALTALVVGGGSNLVHDIWPAPLPDDILIVAESEREE